MTATKLQSATLALPASTAAPPKRFSAFSSPACERRADNGRTLPQVRRQNQLPGDLRDGASRGLGFAVSFSRAVHGQRTNKVIPTPPPTRRWPSTRLLKGTC